MKPYPLFLILLLLSFSGKAQNLVPNPNFENYNTCPTSLSGIAYSPGYNIFPTAGGWISPTQGGTPDYFHTCAAIINGAKVPDGPLGYQQPHSGNAYAGFIGTQITIVNNAPQDYREYLQCKLSQSLVHGRKYCVSFYVSPTVTAAYPFNYIALDEVGVNLSATQTTNTSGYLLPLTYSVKNTPGNFLTDTSAWYKVQGIFTASGGEEWLTLGCFDNGNPLPYQQFSPSTPIPGLDKRAYFFVDDVSVQEITSSDTIRTAHDTVICNLDNFSKTLTAPSATAYLWSNGSTSQQLTVHDTGTYWCFATLDCTTFYDTFRIHYTPFHPLSLGYDTINCHNQPITLTPNYNYNSYLWNTGSTALSITVSNSGTYSLAATDVCGTQYDTVNVTIQPPTPDPIVADTTICQLVTEPQINVQGVNLRWFSNPYEPYGDTRQPKIATTSIGIQTFYVSQTIGLCESRRIPFDIKIKFKPKTDLPSYITLCRLDTSRIGKQYPDVSYAWSTGDRNCCIYPDHSGTYTLNTYNDCGNFSQDIYIDLSPCDECLFPPTAFSPNGDRINDIYKVMVKCPVSRFYLRIYDRWGGLVFSSRDPEIGWSGTANGRIADAGVYVYMLEYESQDSHLPHFLKGNLTLIR